MLVLCENCLNKRISTAYRDSSHLKKKKKHTQDRWLKMGKGLTRRNLLKQTAAHILTPSQHQHLQTSIEQTCLARFQSLIAFIHTQCSSPHFETIHDGGEGKPWRKCHCTTPLQSPSPSPLPLFSQFFSSPEQASPLRVTLVK